MVKRSKSYCYDLSMQLTSFDFYNWLVLARADGAEEIVFDVTAPKDYKWSMPVTIKRFESIVRPGPCLVGLQGRIGVDGYRFDEVHAAGGRYMAGLFKWSMAGKSFPKLAVPEDLMDHVTLPPPYYTVTLRNDPRIPERNSNFPAWREFAKEIGALVIEDYDDYPMPLLTRMTYYAQARMNFGVTTGPLHAVALSNYPAMIWVGMAVGAMKNCGMGWGMQHPWFDANTRHDGGARQSLVWEMDDLDSLRRNFERWERAQ